MKFGGPADASHTHGEERDAKILIVDDELAILNSLSELLSSRNYTVETANSGALAIKKASEINPDIILLDVLLPDMHGVEVCRKLKADPVTRHIPIIVITCLGDKETKLECLKTGANTFLVKPLDHTELLAKADNLLQLKRFEEIKRRNAALETTVEAVENAKREWEQILDCIDDMVLLADTDGNVARCNKALKEFLGKSYDDIIGKNWRELLREGGMGIEGMLEQGTEFLHLQTEKWFVFNLYPFHGYNTGMQSGTVITIRDFTAIKTITEALEITNAAIDKERKELQFALNDISFILQEVQKNQDLSIRFKTPDISTSDSIYQIGMHFNNMMDMLEQKNRELRAAQSRVLQQEKMASIGQLAAGVAHEINNPTGFIMSNLGSLLKYASKLSEFIKVQEAAIDELSGQGGDSGHAVSERVGEQRKTLKIDYIVGDLETLVRESLEGTERIKKIVQDLKSFSRVDEAEHKMADLNAGLDSTINIVWNELKYKATVRKDYGELPHIRCNPGQLNQVFMNILVNAAHAIEKQGEITVKTRHEGGSVSVSISDTGCGIPEDRLGRIFEPFYTTKEVGKGTGLGLSIAYDIVKKHDGEIRVESEVGRGTTFTVRIPVAV